VIITRSAPGFEAELLRPLSLRTRDQKRVASGLWMAKIILAGLPVRPFRSGCAVPARRFRGS
jgi:hypothetical protein